MSRFKQWSTVFLSRVDAVVSRMENHEALVDSAIQEVRQSLARAKVQLNRVQHDRQTLEQRRDRAQGAIADWVRRAAAVASTDEDRALECLRRKHAVEHESEGLDLRLTEQVRVEQRLVADIRAVEERLTRLCHQRNLLRTRESTAAAREAMDAATSPLGEDVSEVLERWEMQVTATEIGTGLSDDGGDRFEEQFAVQEERSALRDELRELTGRAPS